MDKVKRYPIVLMEGIDFSGKGTLIEILRNENFTIQNKRPVFASEVGRTFTVPAIGLSYVNRTDAITHIGRPLVRLSDLTNHINGKRKIQESSIFDFYAYSLNRMVFFDELIHFEAKEYPVIIDRSFPSTLVYQGAAVDRFDLTPKSIILNHTLQMIFSFDPLRKLFPDLIIHCRIDEATFFQRKNLRKQYSLFDNDPLEVVQDRICRYDRCMDLLRQTSFNVHTLDCNRDVAVVYEELKNVLSETFGPSGS